MPKYPTHPLGEGWLNNDQHCCCVNYAVSIIGSALHARLPQRCYPEILDHGLLDVLLPLLAGNWACLSACAAAAAGLRECFWLGGLTWSMDGFAAPKPLGWHASCSAV